MDDWGLLLVRLVIGTLMVGHGTGKLFGWFAGFGVAGTGEYFESLRYRNGRLMAVLAGATEVGAGLGIAAGLLTPLAGAALIGVMISAAVAHGPQGLWSENEGYEYPLVLAVVTAAIVAIGPGSYSLDAALGWPLHGLAWAGVALAVATVSSVGMLATRRPVTN